MMGKWLEKYASSMRFWVLILASVYFGYAVYYAVYGLQFTVQLTHDYYVYGLVTKNPWWWIILYYGSEGVAGAVSIILRAFAGFFAFNAAFLWWRKKDSAMPAIRKKAATALLMETGFFLALIPSIIAAFAYNLPTSAYLFYFEHTPEHILLFGTAIPCLAIVLVVSPLLLKLRSNINHGAPVQEIVKWSALTGVAYLFVVFWFNYTMLWAATMVPYPRTFELYGLSFLLQPTNFLSFAVTVFGLLALATATLAITLPAIRKQPQKINLPRMGAVMVAFGGYFLFNTLYYYLTGTYSAHPSVWYEVIGPLHNPNLWGLAFIFVGLPLIVQGKIKKRVA
jgi:hypothetical protein